MSSSEPQLNSCIIEIETNPLEGLNDGDIIEVNNDGVKEYMIFYEGDEDCNPGVYYTITYEAELPKPRPLRSWYEKLFQSSRVYCKTPKGITTRIKIMADDFDEVLKDRAFKKFNFVDSILSPNEPTLIKERALFTKCYIGIANYPKFNNSKDWAVWCRYGGDIVATWRVK